MKPRICATEIHTHDESGRPIRVDMCRHPMRLSMQDRLGWDSYWVWVCPNEQCGTAHVISAAEREAMTA